MNICLQKRNYYPVLAILALMSVTGLVGCGKSAAPDTGKATPAHQSGEKLEERDVETVHTAETDNADKKTGQ